MIPILKTVFQKWFRADSTGVSPYRPKSDFLSIPCQAPHLIPFSEGARSAECFKDSRRIGV